MVTQNNQLTDHQLRERQASGIIVNWLLDFIESQGLPLTQACTELAIDPVVLHTHTNEIPFQAYCNLLEWAAQKLENPHLGIYFGQNLQMKDLGALGALLDNAPDLFGFCQILGKYMSTFQRNAMVSFEPCGTQYLLRYGVSLQRGINMHHDVEFTLSSIVNFFRRQLGEQWVPDAVFFSHDPRPDSACLNSQFGENIHYNYAYNGFLIPQDILCIQVNEADPQLLQVILRQADHALEQVNSQLGVVKYVRLLIAASLSKEGFNSDDAASELHMTRRTLHRHLQRYDTSFKELRNEVLKEASQQALAETVASVTDIAMQLGFSEVSAFVRCFKRLTGMTPTKYRRQISA